MKILCQIFTFKTQKIPVFWFIVNSLLLSLYSFTQVDLNLTLSHFPIFHLIIKTFQYIGYYNRPLSVSIYIGILISFNLSYLYFLYQAWKNKIEVIFVWKLLIIVVPILFFTYNAFSYDIFNYLFDAKIVTYYHQNPYLQKALDYPNDPMVHFMRWTHRTYPYGPVWLMLTVPLSFAGFGFFIPTIILFKLLNVSCFLGAVYYIGKIVKKMTPQYEVVSMVFIGLSPLFLIESLVSAHNDIVMLFFAVASIYYLFNKRFIYAIVLFALSVGIKFATLFCLPAFLLLFYFQYNNIKYIKWWENIITFFILCMTGAVIYAANRTNFQPWYLIFFLPFSAFILRKAYITIPSLIFMIFSLLEYAPFIYLGSVEPPLPEWLHSLNIAMVMTSLVITIFYYSFRVLVYFYTKKYTVNNSI